jgi:hypothetical protein
VPHFSYVHYKIFGNTFPPLTPLLQSDGYKCSKYRPKTVKKIEVLPVMTVEGEIVMIVFVSARYRSVRMMLPRLVYRPNWLNTCHFLFGTNGSAGLSHSDYWSFTVICCTLSVVCGISDLSGVWLTPMFRWLVVEAYLL